MPKPDLKIEMSNADIKRFLRFVPIGLGPDDCWVWKGSKDTDGYGKFHLNNPRKTHRASRIAMFLKYGSIPEGMNVMHKCDNPPCVNAKHLKIGTLCENRRDAYTKGRQVHPTNNKLTPDQVRAIRLEKGTNVVIGRKFGVRASTVSRIKTRVRWPSLD